MKDVQQIEAVAPSQGDVPNNSDEILATLPEAPEPIEIENEKK